MHVMVELHITSLYRDFILEIVQSAQDIEKAMNYCYTSNLTCMIKFIEFIQEWSEIRRHWWLLFSIPQGTEEHIFLQEPVEM